MTPHWLHGHICGSNNKRSEYLNVRLEWMFIGLIQEFVCVYLCVYILLLSCE